MKKFVLINVFIACACTFGVAQDTRSEVEKVGEILDAFTVDTITSVYDLQLIRQKVELRQKAVYRLEQQIDKVNYQITVNIANQKEIHDRVELTRQELEKILLITYKNLDFYSQFGFIFSSEDFSQAFKRFLFLQELTAYREFQIELLNQYKKEIVRFDSSVFNLRNEQRMLLELKTEEKERLEKAIRKRQTVQISIEEKSRLFSAALKSEKRSEKLMNREIEDKVTIYKTTIEGDRPLVFSRYSKQNRKFFSKKGKLMPPVSNSIVVSFFGRQKHPVLDNVIIKNDGIIYRTPLDAEVVAVHDGVVKSVFQISGAQIGVLVSHGNYFTLYANLDKVDVVENAEVKLGQRLGKVARIKNYGLLKFQIWKELDQLNPGEWLLSYYR